MQPECDILMNMHAGHRIMAELVFHHWLEVIEEMVTTWPLGT